MIKAGALLGIIFVVLGGAFASMSAPTIVVRDDAAQSSQSGSISEGGAASTSTSEAEPIATRECGRIRGNDRLTSREGSWFLTSCIDGQVGQ